MNTAHGRGAVATSDASADSELKARHRKMWASGSYPTMVQTFLLPLGERLVSACEIHRGQRVLDVAAGTGNAAIRAARTGAQVVASDLTPELLDVGRDQVSNEDLEIEWTPADAEHLPFPDESFDVVMSCIGAMFAPHHAQVADELCRVCRPGGRIGLLSWTPEGLVGGLFATMRPFAPPPPPGAQPPPLWGSEDHVRELLADRVTLNSMTRDVLEVTAFEQPEQLAEHFGTNYGPTLVALANAQHNGTEKELRRALLDFSLHQNRGTSDEARFEFEYLLTVGTRA
jgi:ubiquinone/menaquinone biosynthesis C-methylase UbiE